METEHHINDLLRVPSGAEDSALVILERLDPMVDIAGVLRDVWWNPGSDATKAAAIVPSPRCPWAAGEKADRHERGEPGGALSKDLTDEVLDEVLDLLNAGL